MKIQNSSFIYVGLMAELPVGTNVGKHIPPHITLLPWFESSADIGEIVSRTEVLLKGVSSISLVTAGEDLFGPENNIAVTRVRRDSCLVDLHMGLLEVASELGGRIDSRWIGRESWNPHLTHKEGFRPSPGSQIVIDNISLISSSKEDGDSTVSWVWELS